MRDNYDASPRYEVFTPRTLAIPFTGIRRFIESDSGAMLGMDREGKGLDARFRELERSYDAGRAWSTGGFASGLPGYWAAFL